MTRPDVIIAANPDGQIPLLVDGVEKPDVEQEAGRDRRCDVWSMGRCLEDMAQEVTVAAIQD